MEIEKAIEILRTMDVRNEEEAEAFRMGADELKKQIPASLTAMLYREAYNRKNYEIYCPCGRVVVFPNERCCACGQALDWNNITAEVFNIDKY